jgi:hypothetical protein
VCLVDQKAVVDDSKPILEATDLDIEEEEEEAFDATVAPDPLDAAFEAQYETEDKEANPEEVSRAKNRLYTWAGEADHPNASDGGLGFGLISHATIEPPTLP